MFTKAGLTVYIIWSQSSWGITPWKQPEAGGNATHTAPWLMPSRKLDEQQVLCCMLSLYGSQEHVKLGQYAAVATKWVWGLTGTRTAAPMEERAVSLLDARLAPTHAHVSSRDANVRKGFARVTKAGK